MRLLFIYANNNTQCKALLEQEHIPDYVECVCLDAQPKVAEEYGIISVPVWITVKDNGVEVASTDCLNIDNVLHWYNGLKENKYGNDADV